MKTLSYNLFIVIVLLCFSGCAPTVQIKRVFEYRPFRVIDNSIDLKRYPDFLITHHDYFGEHETVGVLSILITPAEKVVKEISPDYHSQSNKITYIYYLKADIIDKQELYDSLYSVAKRHGADAVTRIEVDSYNISGLAIKRLPK